jgi:hypothetical protein
MHKRQHMVDVSWQDKELVTMLSTAPDAWMPNVTVKRRKRGQLVYIQYHAFMRGIDVTDQLRSTYSIQRGGHKWWKKIFSFVLDQSLVNSRIIVD